MNGGKNLGECPSHFASPLFFLGAMLDDDKEREGEAALLVAGQ